MKAVLISPYDLGRQPFGLASPVAWLRQAGIETMCLDLSREPLREEAVQDADLIAIYVPMHTATRLAARIVPRIRQLNAQAHLCFYGLYAPMNEKYLRSIGGETILGGEFEAGLLRLARGLDGPPEPAISLERLRFIVPDRAGLPPLSRYARLQIADESRTTGYTEASRGCKHLCRHCPIVPVYQGHFRIVDREVVLEDIRRQVAAGAEHITFGDPDFFNGIGHAIPIVRRLHEEFPKLTYDVTIKVEHLLKHASHLATLRDTGCLFVTTAVESLDDHVLQLLDKGHSRSDFLEALHLCREASLTLAPTFVAFTPWTAMENYRELLDFIVQEDLAANVAPIQLVMRLLIPAGSRLLELPEVLQLVGQFDCARLSYPWEHPDPGVDRLQRELQTVVKSAELRHESRREIFRRVWQITHQKTGASRPEPADRLDRAAIPYLNEPWYC